MSHWMQGRRREQVPNWRGGRFVARSGKQFYVHLYDPTYPRAGANGYVFEHIMIVERARKGRALPIGAQVHHVNGDGTDNRPTNLVVCENDAYHKLLHQRQRAFAACGNANWRRCPLCKGYDDLENLHQTPSGYTYHRSCNIKYLAARRAVQRAVQPALTPAEIGKRARARHWLVKQCTRGHEYTPENTAVDVSGSRRCRRCRADIESKNRRLREAKKRGAA